MASAWADAAAAERNELARVLLTDVVVTERTAVAVNPLPELRRFFSAMASKNINAAPTPPGTA